MYEELYIPGSLHHCILQFTTVYTELSSLRKLSNTWFIESYQKTTIAVLEQVVLNVCTFAFK